MPYPQIFQCMSNNLSITPYEAVQSSINSLLLNQWTENQSFCAVQRYNEGKTNLLITPTKIILFYLYWNCSMTKAKSFVLCGYIFQLTASLNLGKTFSFVEYLDIILMVNINHIYHIRTKMYFYQLKLLSKIQFSESNYLISGLFLHSTFLQCTNCFQWRIQLRPVIGFGSSTGKL